MGILLPPWGWAGSLRGSVAQRLLPYLLLDAPELVLGVDVILPGILGLGVRVEAVDWALPSTPLAINGALPDQVSFGG